ncbi:MAG: 2-isopropylmalate synthase [Acutalibacteraceae bacterium]|nr:2-isopropylmalate synthase [Clostridia bacterium]MEE3402799.1 2-isopropylmalate synthase [Acutalibacteraceae bacterium]HCA53965.1 2-isopropylmalate synthase [Oscillospiraceae bacterium]
MEQGFKKYVPFQQIKMENREWPDKTITKAPIWCSVDLRDGNQALVDPMNLQQKLEFFHALCDMGFKEIEIGFPSASETEYEICRELIDGHHIPDDVTIQVLVQAREHLIRKTFEAVKGAKNVIVHFYNSTSTLQRKVVFHKDMDGIIDIAVEGAKLIKELIDSYEGDTNFRIEYSPESFSGTEVDNSVRICQAVMDVFQPTPDDPIILNLPNTVEMCTPNTYADQIEYFIKHLKNRESAIISLHPHNDRGTGVACAELALLAGADRIEGTLFGNGERTGNLDIVTVGLNMFTQGVDPHLDFSNLPKYREIYERCTNMKIGERQPYVGDLVFTAFSGSHQDAINKGFAYVKETGSDKWEIPYLPIDPADVGRQYEPIIRINSQSGKGGAAFIMQNNFGYELPKAMHPEFGALVKAECDKLGRELSPQELMDVFRRNYLEIDQKLWLVRHIITNVDHEKATFKGIIHLVEMDKDIEICGEGNGPIDAFFKALKTIGVKGFEFVNYSEHSISQGSDSRAICYIELKDPNGEPVFGVGISHGIFKASVRGIICAINRSHTPVHFEI